MDEKKIDNEKQNDQQTNKKKKNKWFIMKLNSFANEEGCDRLSENTIYIGF